MKEWLMKIWLWWKANFKWAGLFLLVFLFAIAWVALKLVKADKEAAELRNQLAILAASIRTGYYQGRIDSGTEALGQNQTAQDGLNTKLDKAEKDRKTAESKIEGLDANSTASELNKLGF
jgi:hypothetical protein